MFKTASATSSDASSIEAFEDVLSQCQQSLSQTPTWVLVATTEDHDHQALLSHCQSNYPGLRVHGVTSSQGVMTQAGHFSGPNVMGAWAIADGVGSYGVGLAPLTDTPKQDAQQALIAALEDADRPGELPALIWMHGSPGHEESLIAGIQEVVGEQVPIIGGSAADNAIEGKWSLWNRHEVIDHGVSLTVMFPGVGFADVFESGYEPTEHKGKVTRAEGRWLYEIDGRPAADVYDEWAGDILAPFRAEGGTVLAASVLSPLGREVDRSDQMAYYVLSHAEYVNEDGHMRLFTEINTGDEVVLMRGAQDSLIERAGRLAQQAHELGGADKPCHGALIIYCAGCMMKVGHHMDDVAQRLSQALPQVPFMGLFTFGEQGCMASGQNKHGNLMISVLLFVE